MDAELNNLICRLRDLANHKHSDFIIAEEAAAELERMDAELDRPTALEAALTEELKAASAELERLRADAARYAFLKQRLLAVDLAHAQEAGPVLEFSMPAGCHVSANLDKTIDAARNE